MEETESFRKLVGSLDKISWQISSVEKSEMISKTSSSSII